MPDTTTSHPPLDAPVKLPLGAHPSHSPADTIALGHRIGHALLPGHILALHGDLGAGKTHLLKGIAAAIGHPGPVTSPTFTLVHEYRGGRLPLFHIDFYRLRTPAEALALGLDDILDAHAATLIEWAGLFPELLPPSTIHIHIHIRGDTERLIEITQTAETA